MRSLLVLSLVTFCYAASVEKQIHVGVEHGIVDEAGAQQGEVVGKYLHKFVNVPMGEEAYSRYGLQYPLWHKLFQTVQTPVEEQLIAQQYPWAHHYVPSAYQDINKYVPSWSYGTGSNIWRPYGIPSSVFGGIGALHQNVPYHVAVAQGLWPQQETLAYGHQYPVGELYHAGIHAYPTLGRWPYTLGQSPYSTISHDNWYHQIPFVGAQGLTHAY